jgi:hypothetical protein
MDETPRTYATLCFYGDDLDPSRLSKLLGVEPSSSGRKGDPLRRGRVVPRGFWCLTTRDTCASGEASAHVEALAATPGLDLQALAEAQQQYEPRLYIYWDLQDGNGGPMLTPKVLEWTARVGAELHVDLYESAACD